MTGISALAAGAAGASTTTLLNEAARRLLPAAPRLDLVGRRGLRLAERAAGARLDRLARFAVALAADLAANALYYALAARARRPRTAGVVLGLAAGAGAVLLVPALGLGRRPVRRTPLTALLTVAWYGAGGWVAGTVAGAARA